MRRSKSGTILAGAAVAFFLDSQMGGRRRALLRDQVRHLGAVLPRRASGAVQAIAGPSRGALHSVTTLAPWCRTAAAVDDVELKHRVDTELGTDPMLRLNQVNFDAADGIARVRGVAADARMAERIVENAADVEGVRAVIGLMRLPRRHAGGRDGGGPRLPRRRAAGEASRRGAPRHALGALAVFDGLRHPGQRSTSGQARGDDQQAHGGGIGGRPRCAGGDAPRRCVNESMAPIGG